MPDDNTYTRQGKINLISFQINPTTDAVLVQGIIANNKDQAVGDHDLIPGRCAPVRLIEGRDPTVPSTFSKFPKKLERLPNREIAHRISEVLARIEKFSETR